MPIDVATRAAQNLSVVDTSLARKNLIFARHPSPGVGELGSTPETDATALSTAAAMERGDRGQRFGFGSPEYQQNIDTPVAAVTRMDEIGQRRQAIDGERKKIMAGLGMISPQEAGLAAVVMPSTDRQGKERRKEMLLNLHALNQESDQLLREHHYTAIEDAKTAHENLARETHIEASKDFGGLANDLLQIRKNPNLTEGTPDFHNAVIEAAKNHPLGSKTQAGTLLLRGIADDHDKAADLHLRASIPPATVESRYAHLLGNIQAHQEVSKTEEATNIASKKANVPYTKTAQLHADQTELNTLVRRYPSLAATTSQAVAPTQPAVTTDTPEGIRAQYRAGTLTKEQAAQKLKAHGFE